jgi:Protein kinase domain
VLEPGRTFAAYEVLRRLAVGGMGEVYLCRHRLLDRLDAVKVLRPHLAQQPDFRRRFLREALSAARLRHPGVVTVYTADEADGLLYLAMEHVPGRDLASILDGGRLDAARTVRLLAVVADALDAAHAASLVHRDIKPSNLLVTGPGTPAESVTLVDFGISRRYDADTDITRTGEIVGTVAYCAPEQLSGSPVEGACDQYALAGVAFECLTGSVPYPRETQLAIVTAHLTAPPPAVTALRPDLPPAVDAVLARGLAKAPAQRYPSCASFVAALAAALGPAQVFPGPVELLSRIGAGDLRQTSLAVRVGSAGPIPLTVPLDAGVTVVRADDSAAAAIATWAICQLVARHSARALCLATALAPTRSESWMWLNWLPNARPDTPPLSGPHVATSAEAAADLMDRLRTLSRQRVQLGADGPRMLAVLDVRLGARPDDPALPGSGVPVLYVARPGDPAPAGASTVDVATGLCRAIVAGRVADGVPDLVPSGYGRDVADLLPDS